MKTKVFILLSFIFFMAAAMAQEQEYSFMESYSLSSTGQLGLSIDDGFIHVYPSGDGSTKVYFIVFKGDDFVKITREELFEKVEFEIDADPDKLEIRIRNRDRYGWTDWRTRYEVSCEVYVPATVACNLKSSDGNIRVRDMLAGQKCRTSDGDIHVSGITGSVNATTSDGDVVVQEIRGNIFLESSDGDLSADGIEGDGRFSTSDGDIRLYQVSGTMEASTSDGDISFNECAGSLKAVTSDGYVKLFFR